MATTTGPTVTEEKKNTKKDDDLEVVVSGEANETRSNALVNKYKAMADMRADFEDIDIRDCIPTLDEMVKEDLMYDLLEKAANGDTEKDVLNTAYYTEEPPTTELGYKPELNVFIFKANKVDIKKVDIDLNNMDGDTISIPLDAIIEPSNPKFKMNNGEEYDNFKDYLVSKNLIDPNAEYSEQRLQIRLIGINCPEIPHYDIQMMKQEDIVSMTLAEARNKKAYMEKYKYTGTAALDRNDEGKIDFYRIKKSSGEYEYHEIVGDGAKYVDDKKSGYLYKKILVTDDSKKETLVGGYKAKENMLDLISSGNVYFMLDANGIKANKTSSKYKLYYNHWWNGLETVKDMIDQWCTYSNETTLTKLSYSPYGTDGYGRFIGAMYAPKNGHYVNIAKYNIADETKSEANPDFTNSPELNNLGGDNAAAFELYNYEKNNQIWLDSFSEMTKESYKNRIEFHKHVTGIDFTKVRNCSMMIGDTFFLIPPQNIRSLSSIEYEKISVMRGKGSMIKNNTNRDMFLEIDLFFYNGAGVNGIPTEVELPNGEVVTYHMNGLRSLMAQFKLAPYLPIENQFINDVLNIEAVSLINLSVSTVEGMPRLLQATITLRDFNYRIYMPDIPIDYSSNQIAAIAELNPIFAKCFNWEVFRFYYQRLLSYGNTQKEFEYNSPSYNKEIYSVKDALQPVYFCEKDGFGSSDISFYTPDENWLKAALSIKKDEDFYGQQIQSSEKSDTVNEWIKDFSPAANCINLIDQTAITKFLDDTLEVKFNRSSAAYRNIDSSHVSNLTSKKNKNIVTEYIIPMLNKAVNKAESTKTVHSVSIHEVTNTKKNYIEYQMAIALDMTAFSTIDSESLKESVRDALGMSTIKGIFTDNDLIINVRFNLVQQGNAYYVDKTTRPTITGRVIYENEKDRRTVTDLDILNAFASNSVGESGKGAEQTNESLAEEYDYMNPAAMQFLPYIENIELEHLSFSMSNNFSDITLKIMDGFAPQYMGSSDISIDVSLITKDEIVVSMLNALPAHAANIGKLYRRILPCWPIRVRNHYLQLAGVNEVLIDLVEIQTVEGYPGTYEIHMKMTSVDRTMRQRETMKQLESDKVSSTKATAAMRTYWDLDNVLSKAELYPDLSLPTIKELNKYGFQFIRYKQSKQAYPDPDFYLNYSWPYTAYIIKKNLKDVFYNQIYHDQGKEKSELLDDTAYKFFDQMGMEMYQKLDPKLGLSEATVQVDGEEKTQNAFADVYDEAIIKIDEGANETIEKSNREKAKELKEKDCSSLSDLLIYLTACDITDGWMLKPGIVAPVVVNELNLDVEKLECSGIKHDEVEEGEKNNAYAKEVFDLRAETIKAIDEYLAMPIDWNKYSITSHVRSSSDGQDYETGSGAVIRKVVGIFASEEKGRKILELLNPFEDTWKSVYKDSDEEESGFLYGDAAAGIDNDTPNYSKPNTVDFLSGFMYAAAKCISGFKSSDPFNNSTRWEPTQFILDENGIVKQDENKNNIPNCKIESDGKPIRNAETLEEALTKGRQWGMFQIKVYKASDLEKIMKPTSRVTYLSEKELPMYKDKNGKERWHPGFIDPYYNLAGYRSEIGKEYIEKVATNEGANTIAFLRNILMHLRRMIINGQIFSEVDIVAKDYEEISKTVLDNHIETDENFKGLLKKFGEIGMDIVSLPLNIVQGILSDPIGTFGEIGYDLFYDNTAEFFDDSFNNSRMYSLAEILGDETAAGTIVELIKSLPDSYKRSFCARLVLPVLMATTEGSTEFNKMLDNYKLKELNNLTATSVITKTEPNSIIAKFCNAMKSTGMLDTSKVETPAETTSDSQKLWNYIMKEAYTKLAEDPQAYVLHSYYDMLINDKRGRLIRAFPTYYVIFMDEGRKIGSWKLFDNFYNMNAISEITISKSRKIPADTCSFVMSNIYSSYAAEYDNTTKQQYVDVYGLRDVFDSIFCPESYYLKEDSLRRREKSLETVVLQPGVRIHVRLGYGSDASRLPIGFNGVIAEVDVGEVVQVIAQGDGHELCNPLNTLGEVDAVSLTEAQSWTTIFKDLRGSMKRGGESPRNLLSKLLTAKYGGTFKTVAREMFSERFYSDNPFGIYHFGDRRFNSIFEEGEVVQNLYEVCDATLLKGSNELYSDRENSMATPTINTTIQDKTFWDILNLCANSGIGYCGAVRDFGFRSTVCLCKPNHYYAFAYKKIDDENGETEGKIVERRKPFQQYHYYDSYTDIVYNSIKASERNMKTNAIGIWESTDMFWGKSQSTVGPIYLDMNIYPEHQKSMTVDTGLISDGMGGLELNILTHFSENWATSANDNKVNKALAERVTTNVLRESVSNMYCGEICVLGDMSIKPHDRFYVNDVYEDMQGFMEVEGVVYSMSSSTGFTTTVYPDTIVRMAEDAQEAGSRISAGTFFGSLGVSVTGRIMGISTFARLDSMLIRVLEKTLTKLTSEAVEEAIEKVATTALAKFISAGRVSSLKEAAVSAIGAGLSAPAVLVSTAVAVGIFVCVNNVKSWFGSFLRNINALSVYPIFKNQRPLIAGMAGHKGSVRGYQYTEDDMEDSIQGLIYQSVEWLNKGNDKFEKVFPFEFGDILMGMFTPKVEDENGNKVSEWQIIKKRWAETLPLDGVSDETQPGTTELTEEEFLQMTHGSVSKELNVRGQMIPALRTKWRIPSLLVSKDDKLADVVYKKYNIQNVNALDDLKTNEKILGLYPIEDELEIKQAVIEGSHEVVKKLDIAHAVGNAKVQMPFESGNRIIKLFTDAKEDKVIYDLPMLQEDAIYILKLILNDQALKNKKVQFVSGTRVNDIKTWKSTGFAFVLDSTDRGALKNALDNVLKQTKSLAGDNNNIFEYQEKDNGILIIVYAPVMEQ